LLFFVQFKRFLFWLVYQIVSEAWIFFEVELFKAFLKWYILSVRAPAKWVLSSVQRLKLERRRFMSSEI
jgi:hypothetical protein